MSEPSTVERRGRRGGGRYARRTARASGNQGPIAPFITRQIAPVDILSNEASEIIENNAEIILTLPSKTAKRIAKDNNFKVVDLPIELEKRQTKIIWHKELTNHPAYDWIKEKNFV